MTNSIALLNTCIHGVVTLLWAGTWKTLQQVYYRNKAFSLASTLLRIILFMYCWIAGRIPLRQLVYRVLDLPPSMRPLVYDFGQLTTRTEEDYTKQIVFDHVSILVCNSTGNVINHHIIISCAASWYFSALDITILCAFFVQFQAQPSPGIAWVKFWSIAALKPLMLFTIMM